MVRQNLFSPNISRNKLVYEMYLALKTQESMGWEVPFVFGIYFEGGKFWISAMASGNPAPLHPNGKTNTSSLCLMLR